MEFDWDDANETHIARHGVTRVETETVLIDPLAVFMDSLIEDNELRFRQVGSTATGRSPRLTPTGRLPEGIVRVVTISQRRRG